MFLLLVSSLSAGAKASLKPKASKGATLPALLSGLGLLDWTATVWIGLIQDGAPSQALYVDEDEDEECFDGLMLLMSIGNQDMR